MSGRPPYQLFQVTVERTHHVTPRLKRITIDGSCLADYRFGLPGQWLKVFVPERHGRSVVGRAYTIRRFYPISKKLELDFVLHGDDGPASAWAARAQIGDSFEISAPYPRSGFPIQASIEDYLLLGDATALPAMSGILESLPVQARARVIAEVDDAQEEQIIEAAAQVDFTWLHRIPSGKHSRGGLEDAAKALENPPAGAIVWIAAESSIVKAVRKHALSVWGLDRHSVHAMGYWKRGESDHKDEEGV